MYNSSTLLTMLGLTPRAVACLMNPSLISSAVPPLWRLLPDTEGRKASPLDRRESLQSTGCVHKHVRDTGC